MKWLHLRAFKLIFNVWKGLIKKLLHLLLVHVFGQGGLPLLLKYALHIIHVFFKLALFFDQIPYHHVFGGCFDFTRLVRGVLGGQERRWGSEFFFLFDKTLLVEVSQVDVFVFEILHFWVNVHYQQIYVLTWNLRLSICLILQLVLILTVCCVNGLRVSCSGSIVRVLNW